ncbi:MAG: hypothetical protein JW863_15230 [Chitinispirillaceae bacterium]|nr:hypothetical protein [Chitinispirillaceae bacterium]
MKRIISTGTFFTITTVIFQVFGAPDFSLAGFAEGVTGGSGGRTVRAVNASEFTSNCKSSEKLIIEIAGKISNASTSIASNKTIIGIGTAGELTGTTLSITSGTNIIIRNITIHHAAREKDIISVSGGKRIWIDHCEIYNAIGDLNGDGNVDTKGDIEGGDVDWYDGLIDMTGSSAEITISWNRIHDSFKAMLVGSSDSDLSDRKITFHHNWFYNLWERVPSYRSGTGHVFNNYYNDIDHSAVNSRMNAKLRVEGNVFEKVGSGEIDSKTGIEWGPIGAYYSGTKGLWEVSDNIFTDCTGNQPTTSTCSYTPPYDYADVLHDAAEVKEIVTEWSGVGKYNSTGIITRNGIPASLALKNPVSAGNAFYTIRGEKVDIRSGIRAPARTGVLIRRNGGTCGSILNGVQ